MIDWFDLLAVQGAVKSLLQHHNLKASVLGRWKEKGTTEDEMAGWHHRLSGHEYGQAPRVGVGQGGLVCCIPWGRKELDTTE